MSHHLTTSQRISVLAVCLFVLNLGCAPDADPNSKTVTQTIQPEPVQEVTKPTGLSPQLRQQLESQQRLADLEKLAEQQESYRKELQAYKKELQQARAEALKSAGLKEEDIFIAEPAKKKPEKTKSLQDELHRQQAETDAKTPLTKPAKEDKQADLEALEKFQKELDTKKTKEETDLETSLLDFIEIHDFRG